ncbi:MAG: DNA/RNA non-specific endonuclease [Gammaproteobacteria bacterium]|nr:DNA/RNA non-specific endonuclease [Gammaproteobacteria bacterium]
MSGYNPDFIEGVHLPLPSFSPSLDGLILKNDQLRTGVYADYINYTVVTNKKVRAPILAALNIDQAQLKQTTRSDNWKIDSRIGAQHQLGNDYYAKNPWDRGHLARRASAAWGETQRQAQRAADETFYFSNAALQHKNFNQDEWLALENWVAELNLSKDDKVTSFSGPVYSEFSRTITPQGHESANIPAAFFKVVCFFNKQSNRLDVRAFLVPQDAVTLKDRSGRRMLDFQTYQVSIAEIEALTDLQFADEIYQMNPLFFSENSEAREELNVNNFPEHIEINTAADIILDFG